jgi:hypothetical protein
VFWDAQHSPERRCLATVRLLQFGNGSDRDDGIDGQDKSERSKGGHHERHERHERAIALLWPPASSRSGRSDDDDSPSRVVGFRSAAARPRVAWPNRDASPVSLEGSRGCAPPVGKTARALNQFVMIKAGDNSLLRHLIGQLCAWTGSGSSASSACSVSATGRF